MNRILLASVLFAASALPVAAHHPMGGTTPQTVFEGLASGLAHPILGLDHLAFVVGVGLLAARFRHGAWLPFAFLTGSSLGVAVHFGGVLLPAAEIGIVVSVLIMAAVILWRRHVSGTTAAAFFTTAGMFHGYALTEAIVGAEPTPLLAYLIGLVVVQSALSIGTMLVYRWATASRPWAASRAQIAVAAASLVIGMVSLLQTMSG